MSGSIFLQNGEIVAVNKVPFDWVIKMCAEAPGSDLSGFYNHGASAFQDMAPLQRFLTVRMNERPFDVSGSLVVTKDFSQEWTNNLTTADIILENIPRTEGTAP